LKTAFSSGIHFVGFLRRSKSAYENLEFSTLCVDYTAFAAKGMKRFVIQVSGIVFLLVCGSQGWRASCTCDKVARRRGFAVTGATLYRKTLATASKPSITAGAKAGVAENDEKVCERNSLPPEDF